MAKLGLDSIRTTEIDTITSVLDTYLVPIFTGTNVKPNLVTVANLNAGGVLDSNNSWSGTNTFEGAVSIGKSGSAGDIKIYPATASKGYLAITIDDQTGNTAVEFNVNAMGQATVVNLDDPGIATSHLVQSTNQLTVAEADRLDDSAEIETITGAGALSTVKFNSKLELVGAGAVTLDVCPATMIGKIKTIRMSVDNGDVTLALTNIVGGTAATTATFDAVDEELVLVGSSSGKWIVLKEYGVTLS